MDVNNLEEFLEQRGCGEEKFSQVERATYKYTNCGAWCREIHGGIEVGSIVEGVDEGTDTHALEYPFKISEFWDALQAVEDEALEIWNDTHGCEDCGMEHPEYGSQMINPDCKTCKGQGQII
tara:strand:+ start:373 stop:738 length:366 start_codon:yes stop_codon:yes gene_type:complete